MNDVNMLILTPTNNITNTEVLAKTTTLILMFSGTLSAVQWCQRKLQRMNKQTSTSRQKMFYSTALEVLYQVNPDIPDNQPFTVGR